MTRAFLLHDGEDVKRTDELHDFLKPIVAQEGYDWDGSDSGVSVWLSARAGDAFVQDWGGGLRLFRAGQPVPITKWSFPFVYLAMQTIELDNGAHHVNRIHPGTVDLDTFIMPFDYGVEKLAIADAALGELTKQGRERFEQFCTDSEEQQFEIMRNNEGLETAHALINDWFNASDDGTWDNTPKKEKE